MNPNFLKYLPTVYCVRDKYQIIFITNEKGAGAVIIDGKRYTDNVNGVVRSSSHVHRIEIKAEVLDRAGSYTVEFKLIPDRQPYRPQTERTETMDFVFRPIPKDGDINCYIIADTHGFYQEPIKVGQYFGERLNLFILGGDIGHNATTEEGIFVIFELCSSIAKGEIPVIFMRGNHDTRGAFAEFLPDYIGTDRGLTYFSIRQGRLWFVLLDLGEDKADDHPEYGDVADYAYFREEQVQMLDDKISNSALEYDAEGVEVKIALCHVPFIRYRLPCNDIFLNFTERLNKIGVDAMLCGHTHGVRVIPPEKAMEKEIMPEFPTVECSALNRSDPSAFKGTALTIGKEEMTVRFTDIDRNVVAEHIIPIKSKKEDGKQ